MTTPDLDPKEWEVAIGPDGRQHVRRRRNPPAKGHRLKLFGLFALAAGIALYVWQTRYYSTCQSWLNSLLQLSAQARAGCQQVEGAHVVAIVAIAGGLTTLIAGAVLAASREDT